MQSLKRRPAGNQTMRNPPSDITSAGLFDNMVRTMGSARTRRGALKALCIGTASVVCARFGIQPAWAAANCLCGGRTYDSDAACCISGGIIVSKHPIANLAQCPGRLPNRAHACAPNGCGGKSGRRPPQSFMWVSFTGACNRHDCCYNTCLHDKVACDRGLFSDIGAACITAMPPLPEKLLGACLATAATYYSFVASYGQEFYDQAQKESCDCCPPETCTTCAGGYCGMLPLCVGGGDCVCFTTPQGQGTCIHGDTPCEGAPVCASNADCQPGYGCAATSCCGSTPVCGPLCSDLTAPALTAGSPRPRARKGVKTMGGM
jgi:hypothetical protein